MTDASSILVLSACTATKVSRIGDRAILAEELYAGQQHRRLMRGVGAYRRAGSPAGPLELYIMSAGHGLIPGHELVEAYDASFAGLRQPQLHRKAARLGIPRAVAQLLAVRRRLAVLLLGDSYLRAAQLTAAVELGAPTLVLTSPRGGRRTPVAPNLYPVALSNRDASRFSCGLVALKGELVARLLIGLVGDPGAATPLDRVGLLDTLERVSESQSVRSLHQDLAEVA